VRIAHVEVDFLARDSFGLLHIIEVKSEGAIVRGILSTRQRDRLARVASVIAEKEPVQMLGLVVRSTGEILKVPLY
jgi:hypothetical protein